MLVLVANVLWSRYGRPSGPSATTRSRRRWPGSTWHAAKVLAFAIAGVRRAGRRAAGALTGVVNTGEFPLTLSIQLLAAMVLGGTGAFTDVWGGILLVYVPQWSTSLSTDFNLGSGANAFSPRSSLASCSSWPCSRRRTGSKAECGGCGRIATPGHGDHEAPAPLPVSVSD